MEHKWSKPQNKSQYFRNSREENIWSQCPDDDLPELKKKFDKKRFGCRKVEGIVKVLNANFEEVLYIYSTSYLIGY